MELMRNNGVTITSNMIAELTGKRHKNVMADIRKIIGNIGIEEAGSDLSPGRYIDVNNQERPNYTLTQDGLMLVVTKYSDIHRYKLIKYCRELEKKALIIPSYQIVNPVDRAKVWIEEYEEKQKAIEERDHAIKTKAQIGSKKVATALQTASVLKRENNKLKREAGIRKDYMTMYRIGVELGYDFSWKELVSKSKEMEEEIIKVPCMRYGTVNAYSVKVIKKLIEEIEGQI